MKKPSNILAVFIIIFTPLAYGTVHPWSIATLKSLILILALITSYKFLSGNFKLPGQRIFLNLMLLFAVFILIQLIPIPSFILKTLSSNRWDMLFKDFSSLSLGNPPLFHSISMVPHVTWALLSLILFYIAFYIIILSLLENRKTVKMLAGTLMFSGFAISFIALAQKFSFAQAIYWIGLKRQMFYGTFVNANHCALYLSATGIFTFAHFLKENNKAFKTAMGFSFALISFTVFYSFSRSAILSFVIPLALMIYLFFSEPAVKQKKIKEYYVPFIFLFFAIFSLFIWWGSSRILTEIGSMELASSSTDFRFKLWIDSIKAFLHFPLFGSGLGTYEYVIPQFLSFTRNVQIEFAENDYFQLLTETGILGFAIISFFLYFLTGKITYILYKKFQETPRTQLGASFALLSIALNSMMSFNIYIPGIMIMSLVLLAFITVSTRSYK